MKLKDYVTLGNLFCGIGAMICLMHDLFQVASYLLFLAYFFDLADGAVARLTKQYDEFGSHLDTICDFITTSVNGSLLTYYAFHFILGYSPWIAVPLSFFPLTMGTIRQARSMSRSLSYPCYWFGLPRPAAAFLLIAVFNSKLMELGVVAHVFIALTVIVASAMHLSTLPFINHHERHWSRRLRVGMWKFFIGMPVCFALGFVLDYHQLFFDFIAYAMFMYLGATWTQIPRTDRKRMRDYLAGGPLVLPLVHKSKDWLPHSAMPFFDPIEEG